jgi:hypothetical protein
MDYRPINKWQKCDLTEDGIKEWIQEQQDMKYEILCGDTVWIENRVHCMLLTCPKY